jgi:hypothetical protein
MSRLRSWRWRIGILVAITISAYAVAMFVLIESSDAYAKRIVEQLQPGVADAQVQQILAGIRHYKGKVSPGDDAYVFYGVDEFVYVVMEKSGGEARIARVDRQPDGGPIWDRIRRSWERRTR